MMKERINPKVIKSAFQQYIKNHISDVYVERKANLDAQIAPVCHRQKEFENRKGCLDKLTETINYYQKVGLVVSFCYCKYFT